MIVFFCGPVSVVGCPLVCLMLAPQSASLTFLGGGDGFGLGGDMNDGSFV